MGMKEDVRSMKLAAPDMASSPEAVRNAALAAIAEKLEQEKERIFTANRADLEAAEAAGVAQSVQKRLRFDTHKLEDVKNGIAQLIRLPDPLGKVTLARELADGLSLYRTTCPIGVIGVIFEARPDAMVQISTLCIKSGNCAVLKGGKETANTNRVLFEIIRDAAVQAGLPEKCLLQAELHAEIDELLSCDREVDLLIPRGSNAFVRYIMDHTKIPVMGHADGICHIYVDEVYDAAEELRILVDAKTQYPAACNAVETILVKRNLAADFLPQLAAAMQQAGVKVNATKEVCDLVPEAQIGLLADDDFSREYLDLAVSVKLVEDVKEAVGHINYYGSHHTDSILTKDEAHAALFMQMVDSAGVYQNCSTRFADGFRYGFGAEVGISTGKIHARGPVGLEGLVTYKYKLFGHGDIVGDFASGNRSFTHKDL